MPSSGRRRSLSATRPLADSTANFVGRIGASLRISARKKTKLRSNDESMALARMEDSGFLRFGDADIEGALMPYPRSAINSPSLHRSPISTTMSCPSTPQLRRRKYIKEGATQLTSLSTLQTHHRYLFLFDDVLLISKQKGENSYKLKEKVSLEKLWIATNNSTHAFLLGWPLSNYVVHFSRENEKNEWFEILSECISAKFRTQWTNVNVAVKVEGRHQNIRKEIKSGVRASEVLAELITELRLPIENPYELCVETMGIHCLHGIETLYTVLMDYVQRLGFQLSDTQLENLDTCPFVNCRLILRCSQDVRTHSYLNLMNHFRKAFVHRTDGRKLFGRVLEGSMPPQPVLTMIDHLAMNGTDAEGIFRKSPKAATVRSLRSQLEAGQVPDFQQYNPHVVASLLKEYLRSIPNGLLNSGNFSLWMGICEETETQKQITLCRNMIRLLPRSHTVLLRNFLRLLRRVAANSQSKMNVHSLAVCVAPSLLENPHPEDVDAARRVPELATFLIENAAELFEGFEEENPFPPDSSRLRDSTDSGLSETNVDSATVAESPDSALFDSPLSVGSVADTEEEIPTAEMPSNDRTPVLSRENSAAHQFQWRSHISPPTRRLNSHLSAQSSATSSVASPPPEFRIFRMPWRSSVSSTNSASPDLRRATYVSHPDQLRVADLIISHRKKESTDSTRTLIDRRDSMERSGRFRSTATSPIPPSSPYSSSPIIQSPKPTVRRALLSRNDTLGLSPICSPPQSPIGRRPIAGSPSAAAASPRPFRPPRRAAPEILLGEKVSWSVDSIRSVFQRQPDLVPTRIDTLYANLDSLRSRIVP